jgi:hypothetical protein
MKPNVSVIDGKTTITDADTGKPLDWVDTVDIVLGPDNTPILYLGCMHFTSSFALGPTAVASKSAGAAPSPTA